MASFHLFGIRHHGPGSARSLLQALSGLQPDCLLIEGPPDAEVLLPLAGHPEMQPPVALLIYNPKDFAQSAFFPFAEFSPEWQALLYARQHGIPARFMDLPMSHAFALRNADMALPDEAMIPTEEAAEAMPPTSQDPFRDIAALAGYTDPERWWEAMFERGGAAQGIFQSVLDLMTALRESKARPETRETLLREAWMRRTMCTAQKEGFQRIAVVCGAWHTPALVHIEKQKPAADAALLKGLKKVKTEATWIPWSFDRLAVESGYRAGIIAPAWYRLLYQRSDPSADLPNLRDLESAAPSTVFLTHAARLLRAHDFPTSSAHVIEAARLADTLATLRGTALPGIEELRDAAVTVLCDGAEKPLELIDRQLIIGDVLGAVPASIPLPPLRADFEAQVKSARLERSTYPKSLTLDLREEAHGRKSRLLHRLVLLGIPWGKPEAVGDGKQGRFHENWRLHWLPDFEIRLIEAGAWGNTVEDAAGRKTQRQAQDTQDLPMLVHLLSAALKADLPAAVPDLLQRLRDVSTLAKDALVLAEAMPPLAEVLRYGHARRMNLDAVGQLLAGLVPRICLQLPTACVGVNEDVAADILQKIVGVNRALGILQESDFERQWREMLARLDGHQGVAPLLGGLAVRLLFDKHELSVTEMSTALHFRLSAGQPPAEAAQWLEGFLYGSGLLLLHQPALWALLDAWVSELEEGIFWETLPLLRRTFSRFAGPERERMLGLAKRGTTVEMATSGADDDWEMERVRVVLPMLRRVLER